MFSNNAYLKVWEIEDKGNYSIAKVTSSQKNKKTNTWETDFSAKVRFVGNAHTAKVRANDRIKITSCGVTNKYDKERQTTYTNYVIFGLEVQGESTAQPKSVGIEDFPKATDIDLPF